MRILSVHDIHYIRGGACRCFLETNRLLKEYGHEVIPFSSSNKKNLPSEYSSYFLSDIENKTYPVKLLKRLARIVYSFETKKAIDRLLRDYPPDLAHLHNIHGGISPSILPILNKKRIPIIMTLHDYKLFCPNGLFYTKGKICEKCKFTKYYNCILNSCSIFRGSPFKSIVHSFSAYYQDWILKCKKHIDYFIAPSIFMRKKAIEYGIREEKVIHIANFISLEQYTPCYEHDNYIIYFGRIYVNKGVDTLIKAMAKVPRINLLIVGTGIQQKEYIRLVKRMHLKNVRFLGFKTGNELRKLVQRAMFSVLPSRWYENGPFSIYESFALGTPVLGANIGGIPEFIEEEKDGWIFEPNDVEGLAIKIEKIAKNKDRLKGMGKKAREKAENKYSSKIYYHKLEGIYKSLVVKHHKR